VRSDALANAIAHGLLALSVLLYIACLPFDAFCARHLCGWPGWSNLIYGPLGLLLGTYANFTWMANPALFSSWILHLAREKALACVASGTALTIAASFLLVPGIVVDEAGTVTPITGYQPGYWIWLLSMGAACLAGITTRKSHKSEPF